MHIVLNSFSDLLLAKQNVVNYYLSDCHVFRMRTVAWSNAFYSFTKTLFLIERTKFVYRKTSYDANQAKSANEKYETEQISNFRRFLPQVLATTVKNFLLLDLGLSIAFPGIIIPALTGIPNEYNKDEFLSMTPEQASWLGKSINSPIRTMTQFHFFDTLSQEALHSYVSPLEV